MFVSSEYVHPDGVLDLNIGKDDFKDAGNSVIFSRPIKDLEYGFIQTP